ncbi:hypothetical protein Ddc_06304 [Ditylenchus destructor]|nr:hypothetical protein Ddc_06304 [Ditylenchus destructor]
MDGSTRISLAMLFVIWLLSGHTSSVFGNTIGRRLSCMTCVVHTGDTTQLDQFRVRQRLQFPTCPMEPVECGPHQDACVTVTMKVDHRYWIGAGCDQRVNYDYPAHKDGCAKIEVPTRIHENKYVEEGRAQQMVCLCNSNLCNSATSSRFLMPNLLIAFLLIATGILVMR